VDVMTQCGGGGAPAVTTVEMCVTAGSHSGRRVRVVCCEHTGEEAPVSALTGEHVDSVVHVEVDGRMVATVYLGNRDVFPGAAPLVLEVRPHNVRTFDGRSGVALIPDNSAEHELLLQHRAVAIARTRVGTPIERAEDRYVVEGTRCYAAQNEAQRTRDAVEYTRVREEAERYGNTRNSAIPQFRETAPRAPRFDDAGDDGLPAGTFADVPVPDDLLD
jgi:hypothetical protein